GFAVCDQLFERVQSGPQTQIDFVIDTGFLPIPACDGRELFIDIARDHAALRWQRERDGERTVAGEDTDLDRSFRADQLNQELHELSLLRRDLHDRARLLRGLLTEARE